MSDQNQNPDTNSSPDKREEDAQWLRANFPFRSVELEEAFCERVAIKVENGTSDTVARFEALTELRQTRSKAL